MYKTLLGIKAAPDKSRDGLFTPCWVVQTNLSYFEHILLDFLTAFWTACPDKGWSPWQWLNISNTSGFQRPHKWCKLWIWVNKSWLFPANLVTHVKLWRNSDYWDNSSCAGTQLLFWGSHRTCRVFLLWGVKKYPWSLHLQQVFFFKHNTASKLLVWLYLHSWGKKMQSSFNVPFFTHTQVSCHNLLSLCFPSNLVCK